MRGTLDATSARGVFLRRSTRRAGRCLSRGAWAVRPISAAGTSDFAAVAASGMQPTTIATELSDRILTITLDRPDRLNAFTVPMQRELCDVLDQVDADPEVRVVVVTGRGRGFCAGADLACGGDTFDIDAGSPATGPAGRPPPPRRGRPAHPADLLSAPSR